MIDLTHFYQILDTADKVAEERGLFFFVWVAKRLVVHWQRHYILDTIIILLFAVCIWAYLGRTIQRKWRRGLRKICKRRKAEKEIWDDEYAHPED
jgi:hypothetical protein